MKVYNFNDEPIRIYGLPFFEKTKKLTRLPEDVMEKVPTLNFYGRRPSGARMGFRTNSTTFTVTLRFQTLTMDFGMALYNCQSAFVYAGDRANPRFLGLVNPTDYNMKVVERTFEKGSEMEDILIFLPRNEILDSIEVAIEDGASIEAPTPYRDIKPIVYYGSSITEGGCCCNVSNAYNAIISKHLNVDYYNLGFSGSARGELPVAEFINTIDMSLFVLDYDHNAPDPAHLLATHEPFFQCIRDAKPELPILMMSRPCDICKPEELERKEIIRSTYEHAIAKGDKNAYFLDGETFFGDKDRELCSVDDCHPNDLGFHRMATVIEPLIKKILGI